MKFAKFVGTHFSQSITGRLLLIVAVSVLVKGELVNKTVKHLGGAASENQYLNDKFRSSRPEVFCEKGALRSFAKFKVKHLWQSLFLIKLQARDSGTRVFL